MKKALKITGVLIGVIVLLLLLAPIIFKGTLEDLLRKNINKNLNATVSWETLDLSLFSSFPDAALVLKDFKVINKGNFDGDTLVIGKRLELKMGITQLFKSGDDPIQIDALQVEGSQINIRVDSTGLANYDIAIKEDAPVANETEQSSGFTFDLQQYKISDATISYRDETTKTYLLLDEVMHEGEGDFSLDISELKTQTKALVSFQMDNVDYLRKNPVSLDADVQMDLPNQKYTFLKNVAKVNELPLTFDGFVQIVEEGSLIDLTFTTPSSDFKNFLAVIPKAYVQNLDGITTTGDFMLNGSLKGVATEAKIPLMDISVKSTNASFKYPDLPKTVKNIVIDAGLKNDTGLAKDTYVTIGELAFKIDDELFTAKGTIKNITENALIDMALNGTIDLAKINQVWPMELSQELSGVFSADVRTNFDMLSVEKGQYQNIKTIGTANLKGFNYSDPAFKNEITISTASIAMKPGNIRLENMEAKSGSTDIKASGSIQNLIPWVMAKQDLKGRFAVQSNTFRVSDFMAAEVESSNQTSGESSPEAVKIPDFLDATVDFTAKEVIYDNVTLKNTKGSVSIKDETANLSNVSSQLFGGDIAFSGMVNTQSDIPTFNMNLDLKKIDIDQSFGTLSLLKYLAPLAKALDGNLNTQLNLQGSLDETLSPNLKTLVGSALAQIITAEVSTQQTPLLSTLGEKVSFLNLDKLSVKDISTALDFKDGSIIVKPFDFDIKGIKVTASGSHGLDKSIDYNLTMDVPAKYLGSDVTKLLAKLDPKEADAMTVALPVGLSGSMTSPQVSVNTKQAVTSLTSRLIERQKQTLKDKGTGILKDILTGGDSTPQTASDSTNTQTSGNTQQQTTKAVKDILGGLFGNKKKKDSTGN